MVWAAIPVGIIWWLNPDAGFAALVIALLASVFVGARAGQRGGNRRDPVRRGHKGDRRGWRPSVGIGAALWHGIVPFIYVTLRRNR